VFTVGRPESSGLQGSAIRKPGCQYVCSKSGGFEVFTMVTLKSTLFWFVVRRQPDIKEEEIASILRFKK
jgi:hypothetical protein